MTGSRSRGLTRLTLGARAVARGVGFAFARAFRPPPVWAVATVCAISPVLPAYWWLRTYAPLHPDAMVYYGAAQLASSGQIDVIFDPYRMTAFLNSLFTDVDTFKFSLAPWLYPPIFLLAVVPFAALPFGWFYGLFQALAVGASALALGGGKGPAGRLGVIALLCAPPAVINVISGQNALLSLALLAGGFRLLPSRPLVGGVLLGALGYKPQLALLVPVALVAARAWRALAAAAGSVIILILLSAAAFGIEAWTAWTAELLHPPASFGTDWFRDSVMRGFSVYICALRLGAPPAVATLIQLASAAVAAVVIYRVHRGPALWELRLAVLLCGTALATPHLAPYDLVLISCAVVLLVARSFRDKFMAGEALVLGLGWIVPIAKPADGLIGAFAPLVIAGVAGYALAKISFSSASRASEDAQPIRAA